jgi:23S rRNA pseudouridine1911/1915/1917 synthase
MNTSPFPCRILFEDNHLLVVNKPAGIVTQGAAENEESLVTHAKEYLKRKYQKPGNVFLGIVSRLDRLVTGVVVLARTSKAASRLSEQFRENRVDKRYWALVPRRPPQPSGQLVHFIRKNDARHRMEVCQANDRGARQAKLEYEVIQHSGLLTLLEVQLETGRKHQIRIQLEALGIPAIGDEKYGSRRGFPEGIALHARKLTFEHPTKHESLSFEAPVPASWLEAGFRQAGAG